MRRSDFLRNAYEQSLSSFLEKSYPSSGFDSDLSAVVCYAMGGSGKRVRPILALLAAELVNGSQSNDGSCHDALIGAHAVEMIHAYSLVHDDLPCIDNDLMRRGLPSTHAKYGEAFALLAGDALLTDAFRVLNDESKWKIVHPKAKLRSSQIIAATRILSRAAGANGMVGGQFDDVRLTGMHCAEEAKWENVLSIHERKTGQLLGASAAIGAISGCDHDAKIPDVEKLFFDVGVAIGISFQILDDLLDVHEGTGKTKGKDLAQGKLSCLRFFKPEEAKALAHKYSEKAFAKLKNEFGERSDDFCAFARTLLERDR